MMSFKHSFSRVTLAALCAVLLSGCASTQGADGEIHDPLEGINRATHGFNEGFDTVIGKPVAKTYRYVTPTPVRKGVRNFLTNLRSPVNFANQLLQGDLEGAGTDLTRFAINTTVGVAGVFDVAGYEGIKHEPEDFGQTLGSWGVGHGAYLVLPIMGPSSLRDATGMLVDSYADPVRLYLYNTDNEGWHYARLGLTYVSVREELLDALEDLQKNSFDYYAALRSAYYQHRTALQNDQASGGLGAAPTIPDYDE